MLVCARLSTMPVWSPNSAPSISPLVDAWVGGKWVGSGWKPDGAGQKQKFRLRLLAHNAARFRLARHMRTDNSTHREATGRRLTAIHQQLQ